MSRIAVVGTSCSGKSTLARRIASSPGSWEGSRVRPEMTRSGFLSNVEVERFLSFTRPEIRDIALELRNLVALTCPAATERILWGGLSYHDPAKGGPVTGAICQIELERDQVRIAFIHGARLRDPDTLLAGERLSKRYVSVDSYEQAPWNAIRGMIAEAAAIDPLTFGPLQPSRKR